MCIMRDGWQVRLRVTMDPQSKEVCKGSLIPKNPESSRGLQDWLGLPSEAVSVGSKRYIIECSAKSPALHPTIQL